MARRLRRDWPGAWHHVVNRGLARRTVFENRADITAFEGFLGLVCGAGDLEVHAYSFLTTHFHMLVRSPKGRLSAAMQEVENRYVRAFNRGRRRDGPLFRGRFWSGSVENESYWRAVLRYIDRNPLGAGLCARSTDYPHGSAWWYAREGGPDWLCRNILEGVIAGDRGRELFSPSFYPVESRDDGGEWTAEVVERRMRGRAPEEDPLTDLVRAGSAEVQEWMIRKARLADGTEPGWVLVSVRTLREEAESTIGKGAAPGGPDRKVDPRGEPMIPAMLRLHCGLTLQEAAEECRLSHFTVRRRVKEHQRAVAGSPSYRRLAAEVLMRAIRREAGGWGDGRILPPRIPFVRAVALATPDLAVPESAAS